MATPWLGQAQLPASRSLGPPVSIAPEGFNSIWSVRELADGRVLVSDVRDSRLVLVDWKREAAEDIGREGRGPGEYRSTVMLHSLGGDSTLLEDTRNGRWLYLHGARIVGTFEYSARRRRSLPTVVSADRAGRVLVLHPYSFSRLPNGRPYPLAPFAESLLVLVEHRDTGRRDTLARIGGRSTGIRQLMKPVTGGSRQRAIFNVVNPLAAEEQALLFPDGWVAVARRSPYRVEWLRPDGRWVRGAPLPFSPVAVDDAQKQFALSRAYSPEAEMRVDEMPPWPRIVPPFPPRALLAAPDGRLVIRRMPEARRRGTHYDLVDRAGALVGRLALKDNEQIAAIGADAVYVIATDGSDVQWLQRHAWP